MNNQGTHVPLAALQRIADCPFSSPGYIESLDIRDAPYWYTFLLSRHVGIYRPNDRVCTWTARFLTRDKLYRQRRLGPALDVAKGKSLNLDEAVELAFEWFASPEIDRLGNEAVPFAKTSSINCCPI